MSVSKKPILEKALSVGQAPPPCVSFRDDVVPDRGPICRGGGGATRQFSAVSRTYSDVTGGPSAARDARQYRRTKTVSGDSAASALSAQHAFRRAISRQYTLNTVSSVAEEEWRPIFDKVYLQYSAVQQQVFIGSAHLTFRTQPLGLESRVRNFS